MAFEIRDMNGAPEIVEDTVVAAGSLINDTNNSHNSHGSGVLGAGTSRVLPMSGAAVGSLALIGFALVAVGGTVARWSRARAR
jgi:hypothetical protein